MPPKKPHTEKQPDRIDRLIELVEKTSGTLTYIGQLALALPNAEKPQVIVDEKGNVLQGDPKYLERFAGNSPFED